MNAFYVLSALQSASWARSLDALDEALVRRDRAAAQAAYAALYGALLERGDSSLAAAVAADLVGLETPLSRVAMRGEPMPEGLREGALLDLERLSGLLRRDWRAETSSLLGGPLPPLEDLAPPGPLIPPDPLTASHFAPPPALSGDPAALLARLEAWYRREGAGPLARALAFRWSGRLEPIAHPVRAEFGRLVGLERPLARLTQNTEAFLAGKPAHHVLLYGPRGSGKSTAVRALLPPYAGRGLRFVELHPQDLGDILMVMEALRGRPHRYLLFVDDLAFEAEDREYRPLKTLLEGSLTEKPDNVRVYATSNRRHLVRESFSDRPDPLSDDVHGWDTVNERLALADRFGLTITFPSATQARYLEIVRGLAAREGLDADDLTERALRFANWGNGLSGRTAQQFIDALKTGSA